MEHVTGMREMRNTFWVLVMKPEGKNYMQDLEVDGRIISRVTTMRWHGLNYWLRIGE